MELSSVRILRTEAVAWTRKRMKLAQQQQAESLIHFGAGQNRHRGWGNALRRSRRGHSSGWLRFERADPERHSAGSIRRACHSRPVEPAFVATPRNLPSRTRRQLGHAQFHCGNPPPAALPRTLRRMRRDQFNWKEGLKSHAGLLNDALPACDGKSEIAVAVRIDFAAQADLFNLGSFPCHGCILYGSASCFPRLY